MSISQNVTTVTAFITVTVNNSPTTTVVSSPTNSPNGTVVRKDFINPPIQEGVPSLNLAWQRGRSTHYGPYPQYPSLSEPGYLPNDVGVGCSSGVPGGDPKWNEILKKGVQKNSVYEQTVWPKIPTVAVSEAAWNKKEICWQTIKIRNANKPELQVEAVVVDFCPKKGCNWKAGELSKNADIYGQETWNKLGGGLTDGHIDVEILWPEGIIPNSGLRQLPYLALLFGLGSIFL